MPCIPCDIIYGVGSPSVLVFLSWGLHQGGEQTCRIINIYIIFPLKVMCLQHQAPRVRCTYLPSVEAQGWPTSAGGHCGRLLWHWGTQGKVTQSHAKQTLEMQVRRVPLRHLLSPWSSRCLVVPLAGELLPSRCQCSQSLRNWTMQKPLTLCRLQSIIIQATNQGITQDRPPSHCSHIYSCTTNPTFTPVCLSFSICWKAHTPYSEAAWWHSAEAGKSEMGDSEKLPNLNIDHDLLRNHINMKVWSTWYHWLPGVCISAPLDRR